MEQKTGQPEGGGQRRPVFPPSGHAVIGQRERDAPPPELFEAGHQFVGPHLPVVTLVPADCGPEIGWVHVNEIFGERVRRRPPPVADPEFDPAPENGRNPDHRRPHPVRAHSEAAPVRGLREPPGTVEANRVLDAAADQVQQVDRVPVPVVPVADAVEETAAAHLLALPYFAVSGGRGLGFLHDGAQQRHQGREAVGDDESLRAVMAGRVNRHRGRAREGLVERPYAFGQMSGDDRCELALAALVGDGVRQRRHVPRAGLRYGSTGSIFVRFAPRCNPRAAPEPAAARRLPRPANRIECAHADEQPATAAIRQLRLRPRRLSDPHLRQLSARPA